jgi:2-hydroxy-3-keto-5-methylthiopentenyl-1-phosphate phosphatase
MLFVIDFDGTLSLQDTVDTMLGKFAPAAWLDVEDEWLAGRITAVECMQRQIRMVDADHVALENFFRTTELDAGFLPFYRHVSAFSSVAIVSDGLDHAISIALRGAGMPKLPVFANRLIFKPRGIDIGFPHLTSQCKAGNGVCKCAVARALSAPLGGPVVLVGDGKSDACLAANADVVFAKSRLLDYCREQGIAHSPFSTFADVLAVVKTWHVAEPQPAAAVG